MLHQFKEKKKDSTDKFNKGLSKANGIILQSTVEKETNVQGSAKHKKFSSSRTKS